MRKTNSLTEGKIVPSLVTFALPFLVANLLQALYGAADLMIVGQFGDSSGVSAVAVGSQIMQMITNIILGLTTGGTILIGQYLGAGKKKDIAGTIGTIICIFSITGIVLAAVMLMIHPLLPGIMRTPAEAVADTKKYIVICSIGIPFIIGYNATSGIFRGLGDSKSPLKFIAVACAINIVGDYILVRYFHMGASGAAIATITAQGCSFLLALFYLKKRGFDFPFGRENIRIEARKAKNILRLGLPISIQDGLITVSFLIIMAIINTKGLVASASVGVVEKVISFSMLIPSAFASAIAVMTAQNIGAGKPDRAQKGLYAGIGCSLVFGILFCLACQVAPTVFTRIFSADPAVIEMGGQYLRSYSLDCIIVCVVFCMNSFFSGCGHPAFSMAHSLAATFLIRVPGSYLISRIAGAGLYEIGWAAPAATFLSALICIIYMRSGLWKSNNILRNDKKALQKTA